MLLFKRNIKKKKFAATEVTPAIIVKWKYFKQRIAAYLQRRSELLSGNTKKYMLILFCILFGGSSIAIIIQTAVTKVQGLHVMKISNPTHVTQDVQSFLKPDSVITKREYERIMSFKNYLLHLKDDSVDAKKFDSVMQIRPELMDSIKLFEKIYLSQ